MNCFFSKFIAIALIAIGTAHAAIVDFGTYSVEYNGSTDLYLKGLPGFSNTYFSMGGNGTMFNDGKTESLTATFKAGEGKVFDKLNFLGTGGLFAYNEFGTTFSQLIWTIAPSPTHTGSAYGGMSNNERSNFWKITSPSTGLAYYSKNLGNNTTTEEGFASDVVYDIGVSEFSLKLDSLIGGSGNSAISIQALGFSVSFRDAPPISNAVPEPETYAMMLAGLGVIGAIARRRKAKLAG